MVWISSPQAQAVFPILNYSIYLIIHILASLQGEYEVAVSFVEDCLMDLSLQMTLGIETICKKTILCHDRVKQHEKDKSDKQSYFTPQ